MRVLFVSSTTVGGSGRSQRELATRLVRLGVDVLFLVVSPVRGGVATWWDEQLDDAAVRLRRFPGVGVIRSLRSRSGRRVRHLMIDGLAHECSAVPELAASKVIERFGPDVVVGNSVRRATWETVVSMCRAAAIPTVLYVREEDSLAYFDGAAPPGDAFVANARSLRESVSRTGVECAFIPSVIETGPTRTESLRRTALVVNPVESRGASIVERIARAVPEVSFVVQESWPLGPTELRWVETHLASLPNVEFRRAGPPGSGLYGDARVLLVPYRVDNRPRVIAEAQANGIPVIVGDVPALREALGDGGLVVPLEDVGEWAAAIRRAFDDATWYGDLVEGARIHSRRDEIAPHLVAQAFVDLLSGVLERHGVGR